MVLGVGPEVRQVTVERGAVVDRSVLPILALVTDQYLHNILIKLSYLFNRMVSFLCLSQTTYFQCLPVYVYLIRQFILSNSSNAAGWFA